MNQARSHGGRLLMPARFTFYFSATQRVKNEQQELNWLTHMVESNRPLHCR